MKRMPWEDAHFINSVHNRIRTFVSTRRAGSFRYGLPRSPCNTEYVDGGTGSLLAFLKTNSDLGTWEGGTVKNTIRSTTPPSFASLIASRECEWSRNMRGRPVPRSHPRPHSAPGRLADVGTV